MAPELFLAKSHAASVDVFAFGVLLNELWAREVPWDGYSPLDIRDKVRVRIKVRVRGEGEGERWELSSEAEAEAEAEADR